MRNSILLLALIANILVSCNERTTESEIVAFEKELGAEESKGLAKVVEHFERELLKRYQTSTVEEAYEKHLNFILESDGLSITQWLTSQIKKDSIFSIYSDGLIEEIWIKPDSVWISDSLLFKQYRGNKNPTGKKIRDWITNYDSLVYYEQKTENFNSHGNYLNAIQVIGDTNEIAEWYYEMKSNAGTVSPHVPAQVLLNSRVELDDYLVKRIILIETYNKTCSNKR
jgi:hypothetical protein